MMPDGWNPPTPLVPITPLGILTSVNSSAPSNAPNASIPQSQTNTSSTTAVAAASAIQTASPSVKASQEVGTKSHDDESDGHRTVTPLASLNASGISLLNQSHSLTNIHPDDLSTKKANVKNAPNALTFGSGVGSTSSGTHESSSAAIDSSAAAVDNSGAPVSPAVDSAVAKEGSGWGWFKKGEKVAKKG